MHKNALWPVFLLLFPLTLFLTTFTSAAQGFTITASATGGGSISPAGDVIVSDGGSQTFNVVLTAGYELTGLLVDGNMVEECLVDEPTDCWVPTQYTFSDVSEGHTIIATFASAATTSGTTYTIDASSSAGGKLSSEGPVVVPEGSSKTFTATAELGYVLTDLKVDGTSQGAMDPDEGDVWIPAKSYTFSDVSEGHTIIATFASAATTSGTTYTIDASSSAGGKLSSEGPVVVPEGSSKTFTATAELGYVLTDLKVDGTSQGAMDPDEGDVWIPAKSYTFSDVSEGHTIIATFASAATTSGTTYTIDASSSAGGKLSSEGPVVVPEGSSKTFTATAELGYVLTDLKVDGTSQGAMDPDEGDVWIPAKSYTFSDVSEGHTIIATFASAATTSGTTYTIDASSSAGGKLSSEGPVVVPEGSSKTFTATAELGYVLTDLKVDGTSQGAMDPDEGDVWIPAKSYTFTNVSEVGHTIAATFVLIFIPDPVMLESDQSTFTSIQTAYDSIPLGESDIIKIKAGEQAANLVFDRDVIARIEGGYDSTISNIVSYTSLYGTITITDGTVIVSNLIY